jgi:uncharacterized protein (TIGR03435 family)
MTRARASEAERRTKLLLIAAAWVAVFVPTGFAQVAATPAPVATKVESEPAKLPEWDVVSVKPTQNCPDGSGMQINKDGIHIFCLPVRALIQIAWGINEPSRVLGAPKWAGEETYDIDAKVDGGDVAAFGKLSGKERNRMLQALLQDRFKLQAHLETRELPVYELVVAKGSPKLKEAAPEETAQAMLRVRGRGEIDSVSMPLHSLPSMLARELDRPVVDKTGLTGNYDFILKFSPAVGAAPDSQDPSIFTAIQEQLGLKLEPAKAPLDVLLIERVEEPAVN